MPAELQWQVFRGADVMRQGLLTEHQLRSTAWIRLRQDVYADARLERNHHLACRAIALRLPKAAVIAGPSAAYLHGVDHAAGFTSDIHVIIPTTARLSPQRRVLVHCTDVDPGDITDTDEMPHTTAARTAHDVATWLPVPKAVAIIDGLLRRRRATPQSLYQFLDQRRGMRGYRAAAAAFDLADPASKSPYHSHLRVRLIQDGLPRPTLQHTIPLPTGLDLEPDLAWPKYGVAVNFDDRQFRILTLAGWTPVHAPTERFRRDYTGLLKEIRRTLVHSGWNPE
jgi:hypothetical protein